MIFCWRKLPATRNNKPKDINLELVNKWGGEVRDAYMREFFEDP